MDPDPHARPACRIPSSQRSLSMKTIFRRRTTLAILAALALGLVSAGPPAVAQDKPARGSAGGEPWETLQAIRVEAFVGSDAMEVASYLTDVFGPRLANSPSYRAAAEWAHDRLRSYGLANAELRPYGEFGVTWRNDYTSVHMMTPQYMPVIAYPNTWSHGIDKTRGPAVALDFGSIETSADLDAYRGKLDGGFVFIEPIQEIGLQFTPPAARWTPERLAELEAAEFPRTDDDGDDEDDGDGVTWSQFVDFVFSQGAVAVVAPDGRESFDNVLVNEVPGRAWLSLDAVHPPYLVFAAEHYNRVIRVLDKEIPVEIEAEVKITIRDEDRTDVNVIAEIRGSDLAHEVVMLGAHLDANSPGQGATDNVVGVAAAMEAMRILQSIGAEPRRTIRVALWGGEEYGLVGSQRYVDGEFGRLPARNGDAGGLANAPLRPAHENFSIYINKDGGGGTTRGVYLQGNERLRPIFEEFLRPLHSLGATTVSNRTSGNSDHASFDDAGLPSVHLISDPLERRAYHTNMDTFDRLVEEDIIQSAIVMASLAYQAAMHDTKMPRTLPSSERRHQQ